MTPDKTNSNKKKWWLNLEDKNIKGGEIKTKYQSKEK